MINSVRRRILFHIIYLFFFSFLKGIGYKIAPPFIPKLAKQVLCCRGHYLTRTEELRLSSSALLPEQWQLRFRYTHTHRLRTNTRPRSGRRGWRLLHRSSRSLLGQLSASQRPSRAPLSFFNIFYFTEIREVAREGGGWERYSGEG